jgi:hypothetical protein
MLREHKLVFIGDAHGKIDALLRLIGGYPRTTQIFQLGDLGLGFGATRLPERGQYFRWIRGNHDDPAQCRAHPNYLGDFGFLPDLQLFYLGGGFSIDHEWRKDLMRRGGPHVWWPDEELSPEELEQAEILYAQCKPKIVISHECPLSVATIVLRQEGVSFGDGGGPSRTSKSLQRMFDMHPPRHWIFGHYHVDRIMSLDGTTFRCCAELSCYELEIGEDTEEATSK